MISLEGSTVLRLSLLSSTEERISTERAFGRRGGFFAIVGVLTLTACVGETGDHPDPAVQAPRTAEAIMPTSSGTPYLATYAGKSTEAPEALLRGRFEIVDGCVAVTLDGQQPALAAFATEARFDADAASPTLTVDGRPVVFGQTYTFSGGRSEALAAPLGTPVPSACDMPTVIIGTLQSRTASSSSPPAPSR